MENKSIQTNMFELIDFSDKEKVISYAQYLKCYRCNEFMLDPKQCTKCGYSICNRCKTCSHELTQSRHIKTLLDSLSFKCKFHSFGCNEVNKYVDVRKHLVDKCQFSKDGFIVQKEIIPFSASKNNAMEKPKEVLGSNDYVFMSSEKIFNTSVSDYERLGVKCGKCQYKSFNKDDYVAHSKICFSEEVSNLLIDTKESLMKSFLQMNEDVKGKYREFAFCKIEENKNLGIDQIKKFQSSLQMKRDFVKYNDGYIKKLITEEIWKEDQEYLNLIAEEEQLLKIKDNLKKQCEDIKEKSFIFIKENEIRIKEELKNRKDELMMLEVEDKWAREELESSFFVNEFGEKCATCGNAESIIKKFFCQICREKYCIDKCSYKCKSCIKFICPKDGRKCKLCHKSIYCDACQKKCFYSNCLNTFCPECYKKNEHQARNAHTNCKLFTCEKDNVNDCLMTSMYCGKCEKRLCNSCLISDKEHFPFLK